MKKIITHYECGYCDLKAIVEIKSNKHGFFEIPNYYCPNDMSLVSGTVKELPVEIEGVKDGSN